MFRQIVHMMKDCSVILKSDSQGNRTSAVTATRRFYNFISNDQLSTRQ